MFDLYRHIFNFKYRYKDSGHVVESLHAFETIFLEWYWKVLHLHVVISTEKQLLEFELEFVQKVVEKMD